MPAKTMGEEAADRRKAEKAGQLDDYLNDMGAGDDVTLRQGYRRIDEPEKKEKRYGNK